jgi:addiction module HigA family antidote
MTADTVMPPVHPGEILLEEFLTPLGVSQYRLAKAVDFPARRINEIVHGQRPITADTALRLGSALRPARTPGTLAQVRRSIRLTTDAAAVSWGKTAVSGARPA